MVKQVWFLLVSMQVMNNMAHSAKEKDSDQEIKENSS